VTASTRASTSAPSPLVHPPPAPGLVPPPESAVLSIKASGGWGEAVPLQVCEPTVRCVEPFVREDVLKNTDTHRCKSQVCRACCTLCVVMLTQTCGGAEIVGCGSVCTHTHTHTHTHTPVQFWAAADCVAVRTSEVNGVTICACRRRERCERHDHHAFGASQRHTFRAQPRRVRASAHEGQVSHYRRIRCLDANAQACFG
jgi:hypothetical protein